MEMTTRSNGRSKTVLRRIRVGLSIVLLLVLVGGLAWGLRGQGLRVTVLSKTRAVLSTAKAALDSTSVTAQGDFSNRMQFIRVIFLHHSTGQNLIEQGEVREAFSAAGYDFWDHGYNDQGLTRPDGTPAGYNYRVPNDNTDPDGFARIFSQSLYTWPANTFSGLMQHEAIIFKSCFPVSHVTSDTQLAQYKSHYLQIRDVMDQHVDHIFVVVTPPPLNPAETDAEAAARARAFAKWLKSDEFLAGHPNVFTFDFFNLLAESDPISPDQNMLRAAYRDGSDSHPNRLANQNIGPLFVDFVDEAVQTYRAGIAKGDDAQ